MGAHDSSEPFDETNRNDESHPSQNEAHGEDRGTDLNDSQRWLGLLGAISRQFEQEGLTCRADELSWQWHELFDIDFADALANAGVNVEVATGSAGEGGASGAVTQVSQASQCGKSAGGDFGSPSSSGPSSGSSPGSGFDSNFGGCNGNF